MGQDGVRVSRLGLVGVGAWGRRYIDTIGRRQDCRIAAFARGSNKNDGALPGIPQCPSWDALIALGQSGELDGLVVAATPDVQTDVAEAAILAGVPLLVEKPLALSTAGIQRLQAAASLAAKRSAVVVDYIHLWSPAYQAMKARIGAHSDGPGLIASIESEGCNWGPFRTWSSLHDYGPHDLAMSLDLLGMGAAVRFNDIARTLASGSPRAEIFTAQFTLDAVPVSIRVGNGNPGKVRRFVVTMTNGRRLIYDDTRPHPFKLIDNNVPVVIDEQPALDVVLTHFMSVIGPSGSEWSTTDNANGLEFSLRIASIIDAIVAATKDQ